MEHIDERTVEAKVELAKSELRAELQEELLTMSRYMIVLMMVFAFVAVMAATAIQRG